MPIRLLHTPSLSHVRVDIYGYVHVILILFLLLPQQWFACVCRAKFVELTFHVTEHSEPNTCVGNLLQSIALPLREIRSIVVESPPQGDFNNLVYINATTGDICTAAQSHISMDREVICPPQNTRELVQKCQISLLVSINKKILVSLHLIIDDLNDSPPVFIQNDQIIKTLSFRFLETAAVEDTSFDLPIALDPDLIGPTSPIIYHLIGKDLPFYLLLRGENLTLHLSTPLDYERDPLYTFFLEACEGHRAYDLCSSVNVTIHVINMNDHIPVFLNSTYNAVIDEDTPVGTTVLIVKAIDGDSPPFGNVSYFLVGSRKFIDSFPFAVDERSGQIFLKSSQLEPKKYSFVVEATDDVSSMPTVKESATALIVIFVADVNNHKPTIEMKPFSNVSLPIYATIGDELVIEHGEEVMDSTVLAYLTVTDHDEGANALCSCQLVESPFTGAFELTKVNQLSPHMNVYRLVASKPLDAEDALVMRHLIQPVEADQCKGVAGFLAFKIICSDLGKNPLETQQTIYIALKSLDEYPTKFVYPDSTKTYRLSVQEDVEVGTRLMQIEISDDDTGKCIQTSTDVENLQILIEPRSGSLILASPLDFEKATSIAFTISASEQGSSTTLQSASSATATVILDIVNVNDNQPYITSLKSIEDNVCEQMISVIKELINQSVKCFSVEVEEEVEVGFLVHHLVAFDADTPNTTSGFTFTLWRSYSVMKQQRIERLKLSPLEVTKKGEIVVAGRLDRERFNWIDLLISVSDGEESSLSLIRVNLLDINDNPPVWQFPSLTDHHISVSLFAQVGAVVSRIQALDADSGILNGDVEYAILFQPRNPTVSGLLRDRLTQSDYGAHLFALNPHTGKLSIKQPLPNQTEVPYRLDLLAKDKGKLPLESMTHLLISLVNKPLNEMPDLQLTPMVSSNNLQNDGDDTVQLPPLKSATEKSQMPSPQSGMENWIPIIGISAAVLALFFFIAIIIFVLCKRIQSGSHSFYQKPLCHLELQTHQRELFSPHNLSPIHSVSIEKPDTSPSWTSPISPPTSLPVPRPHPIPSSPSLSLDRIPTYSIAFSGHKSSQLELIGAQNVPVIVSVAVLPPSSPILTNMRLSPTV